MAPGASKPSKLLLQYSVELSLRVDGHGSSGGRRRQARRRSRRPGKKFSSAIIARSCRQEPPLLFAELGVRADERPLGTLRGTGWPRRRRPLVELVHLLLLLIELVHLLLLRRGAAEAGGGEAGGEWRSGYGPRRHLPLAVLPHGPARWCGASGGSCPRKGLPGKWGWRRCWRCVNVLGIGRGRRCLRCFL